MANYNYGAIIANGVQFNPQELSLTIESLADENSGRTQDGVMHINWIWNKIRKIEIKLPPMTGSELSNIMGAVQGQIYDITYFDTLDDKWETRKVYTSNSSFSCYSGVYYHGLWQDASFNAIEIAGELTAPYIPNVIDYYKASAVIHSDDLVITTNGSETYSLVENNLSIEDDSGAEYWIEDKELYRKD